MGTMDTMGRQLAAWMRKRQKAAHSACPEDEEFFKLCSIRVRENCVEMEFGDLTWQFIGIIRDGLWQTPRPTPAADLWYGDHLLQSDCRLIDVFGPYPNCEIVVIGPYNGRQGVKFPTAEGTFRAGHHLVQAFMAHLLPVDRGSANWENVQVVQAAHDCLFEPFLKVREQLSAGKDLQDLLDCMFEFGKQVTEQRRKLVSAGILQPSADRIESSDASTSLAKEDNARKPVKWGLSRILPDDDMFAMNHRQSAFSLPHRRAVLKNNLVQK